MCFWRSEVGAIILLCTYVRLFFRRDSVIFIVAVVPRSDVRDEAPEKGGAPAGSCQHVF